MYIYYIVSVYNLTGVRFSTTNTAFHILHVLMYKCLFPHVNVSARSRSPEQTPRPHPTINMSMWSAGGRGASACWHPHTSACMHCWSQPATVYNDRKRRRRRRMMCSWRVADRVSASRTARPSIRLTEAPRRCTEDVRYPVRTAREHDCAVVGRVMYRQITRLGSCVCVYV